MAQTDEIVPPRYSAQQRAARRERAREAAARCVSGDDVAAKDGAEPYHRRQL